MRAAAPRTSDRLGHLCILFLIAAAAISCDDPGDPGIDDDAPASLSVSPDEIELNAPGSQGQLDAMVRDGDGEPIDAPVQWSSTDSMVARVDSTGLVTALGFGTAKVVAESGTVADTSVVHVVASPELLVRPSSVGLTGVGATQPFTASVVLGVDTTDVTSAAEWLVSNGDVASVSSGGVLTSHRDGQVAVRAVFDGDTAAAVATIAVARTDVLVTLAPDTSAPALPFSGIWGASQSDIHAIGGDAIYHYDGFAWQPLLENEAALTGFVWGLGPTEVFATVALNGSTDGPFDLLRFDGAGWTRVMSVPGHAIWGILPDALFAISNDALYRYDGSEWHQDPIMVPGDKTMSIRRLTAIWGADSSDVFAVGHVRYYENPPFWEDYGAIFHFDGDAWQVTLIGAAGEFHMVWGTSANDVVAVGAWAAGARPLVAHWDGAEWRELDGIPVREEDSMILLAGWGSSALEMYVGERNGPIYAFDGNDWHTLVDDLGVGGSTAVFGLWGTAEGSLWAATNTGILRSP